MRTVMRWVARTVLMALVGAVVARVLRALRGGATGGGVVPAIGGDTWPPVPVKPVPAPLATEA